ncbi:MAG TPA: hypothetical protein VFJ19_17455 [Nocardioidaceae bacterium]|nr:hypothetical protein [Nocardioidaceae bacterium]
MAPQSITANPLGKQFDALTKQVNALGSQFGTQIDASRPFYAAVGAGDLAVEFARTRANDVQTRIARIDLDPTALREQALSGYADLAARGKSLVARVRRQQASADLAEQAEKTTTKAKTTATQARKSARTTKSSAKATGTSARKTAGAASKATKDAASKTGK